LIGDLVHIHCRWRDHAENVNPGRMLPASTTMMKSVAARANGVVVAR
jgi:hypothetical protein